jgi:hypothetical protein
MLEKYGGNPSPRARASSPPAKIRLLVNMQKVIESLADKGFCDRSGNPKPNFQYFQGSQKKTVARVASLLRGLTNYYQMADSKRRYLSRLSYILTHSVAMMFAAKFKLGTRAKVFGLAGRNLIKPLLSKKRKQTFEERSGLRTREAAAKKTREAACLRPLRASSN